MNTQTQEYEKLKQEGISKILENGNGSWYDLVNDGFDLAEKLRQATQPIAAEGKSAGVWVRASERMPELYPVNNSHEFHYRLDSYKVDGFFLHSQCFEYFNPEIAGYTQLELTEFNRIEWLDEYASQPKGAGVDWEKLQDSISEIAIEQMNVLEIHKWWDFGDYEEIRGQDSAAFEIGAAVVNYLKSDEFSSLPSQEGNTN